MTYLDPSWGYENHCGNPNCDKTIRTPTIGNTHILPVWYCSRPCETIAKNPKASAKIEVNSTRAMPKRNADIKFPVREYTKEGYYV